MQHVLDNPKVSVWCGITSDRTVGPCFLHKSITTCVVYLDMLENFMFPQIVAEVDSLTFQQVGAIVRTTLDERFRGRWIGKGGPNNWPPRNRDFNTHELLLGAHLRHRAQRRGRVFSRFAQKDYTGCRCGACGCALSGVGRSGFSFRRL
jgi:hypothetical protein